VEGEKTSPEVKATVMKMGQQIGKVPVLVGNCDGFVGNRMLHHYIRQAKFLLEEGATPAQVDKVIFDFGFAMGPFAMSDLAGNDVSYLVSQEALKKYGPSNLRTSEIVNRLYEEGRYGQKTSKGYYLYEEGSRAPIPDPAVDAIIAGESKRLGIERREVGDEEILERCMFALVNEGAKILDEGIAARPLDIDLIYIYGYSLDRVLLDRARS
jgi:3-hydroxyacyl-CoA dehydrogenase